MKKNQDLSKGEKILLDLGLYVSLPINLQILLEQSERDVLNSLRHCYNLGQEFVSASVLALMTGLGERTIRRARDKLIEMRFLEKSVVCGLGTHYAINYKRLCSALIELNNEPDPLKRIELAKQLRNKELKTLKENKNE